MTLKQAIAKIDASVEAYRVLLRDNPEDYEEAAERQQDAADLMDQAQTLGMRLSGDDRSEFSSRFATANIEIEDLETKRLQGGYDEEDPDGEDDDIPEDDRPDSEDDQAEVYSTMAEPADAEEDDEK